MVAQLGHGCFAFVRLRVELTRNNGFFLWMSKGRVCLRGVGARVWRQVTAEGGRSAAGRAVAQLRRVRLAVVPRHVPQHPHLVHRLQRHGPLHCR